MYPMLGSSVRRGVVDRFGLPMAGTISRRGRLSDRQPACRFAGQRATSHRLSRIADCSGEQLRSISRAYGAALRADTGWTGGPNRFLEA